MQHPKTLIDLISEVNHTRKHAELALEQFAKLANAEPRLYGVTFLAGQDQGEIHDLQFVDSGRGWKINGMQDGERIIEARKPAGGEWEYKVTAIPGKRNFISYLIRDLLQVKIKGYILNPVHKAIALPLLVIPISHDGKTGDMYLHLLRDN